MAGTVLVWGVSVSPTRWTLIPGMLGGRRRSAGRPVQRAGRADPGVDRLGGHARRSTSWSRWSTAAPGRSVSRPGRGGGPRSPAAASCGGPSCRSPPAVLLGCLVLAVIQGALAGEPMVALRAAVVEVPRSIFGMATVVALTGVLGGMVDSASAAVLPAVGSNFGAWFAKTDPAGFFGAFVELLVLLGALLTWVELVVRQGLVFLLVALSPMVLAVRVWPAAAGVWRRLVELGVALIVSKFVIALALALGSDALAGSVGSGRGASLTAMTTGAGLMLLAALSPFVLLRMLPGVEAAVGRPGDQPHAGPHGHDGGVDGDERHVLGPPGRRRAAGVAAGRLRRRRAAEGPERAKASRRCRHRRASSSLARAAALDVDPARRLGRGARSGVAARTESRSHRPPATAATAASGEGS